MKDYKDTRIVIIGFGYLMGYMYDCYAGLIGKKNLCSNVMAVTADRETLEAKRKKYPFGIIADDNLGALRAIQPDLILFAPPPSIAPSIIQNELKTYFKECTVKPDIYAFPPSPAGQFYIDELGDDIFVCNILPNMVKEIGGKSLKGREGYSTVTFPINAVYDESRIERLSSFLRPLGDIMSIEQDKIMDVLAAYVMIDLWPYRTMCAAESLGLDDSRSFLEKGKSMDEMIVEYSKAVKSFLVESGIDEKRAEKIVEERNKLVFHQIKETSDEELMADMKAHSTKGGVFEKGMALHDISLNEVTMEYISGSSKDLSNIIKNCLEIISSHGRNLASKSNTQKVHPGIHAMTFAIFARKIKKKYPAKADGIIERTVVEYALQRGRRMRIRAENAGAGKSMEDYMAYGEWNADAEKMDIRTVREENPAVTRVYECPWCSEWKKFGYMKEGLGYCRHIDKSLVRGFNEDLELGLDSIKPEGNEYCEFVWNGASLDRVSAVEKEYRIMPWEFHIAHLLDSIQKNTRSDGEIMESIIKDIMTLYGIDIESITGEYINRDFNTP